MRKIHKMSYLKDAPAMIFSNMKKFQNYYLMLSALYPIVTNLKQNTKYLEHQVERRAKKEPVETFILAMFIGIMIGRMLRK